MTTNILSATASHGSPSVLDSTDNEYFKMSVLIRDAITADIPFILKRAQAPFMTDRIPLVPSRAKILAFIITCVTSKEHYSKVIVDEGVIVGALGIAVHEIPFFEGKQATMMHNSCDPQYSGWGARIMRDGLKWARSNPDIKLIIWSLDHDADPRYESLLKRLGLSICYHTYQEFR